MCRCNDASFSGRLAVEIMTTVSSVPVSTGIMVRHASTRPLTFKVNGLFFSSRTKANDS